MDELEHAAGDTVEGTDQGDAVTSDVEEASREGDEHGVGTPPIESSVDVEGEVEEEVGVEATSKEGKGDEGDRGDDVEEGSALGESVGTAAEEGEESEEGGAKEIVGEVEGEGVVVDELEHEEGGEVTEAESDAHQEDEEGEPEPSVPEQDGNEEIQEEVLEEVLEEEEEDISIILEADEVVEGEDEQTQPTEFFIRTKMADDDFTLDRQYDENEIQFELEEQPSETSFILAPPVGRFSARLAETPPSVDTLETVEAERERSYELQQAQFQERCQLQRRNKVLQRKLMEHFKKRKINEPFKTATEEVTAEVEGKYLKKLGLFGDLQASFEASRLQAMNDVDAMTAEEARLEERLQDAVDRLVALEKETAAGLIDAKTGKVIAEKIVERLLKRQVALVRELGDTRLVYIKLKEKVAAKEDDIRILEDLGQGLSMMDYEQLRMEIQNLSDKIEERDDELARLRARALHSAQALTHYKEKMSTVIGAMDRQLNLLKQKENELEVARSELNTLKATRDKLRADFVRESAQSGLLTKPQLLRDFENTLDECAAQRAQLQQLQEECAAEKGQLTAVKEALGRSATVEVEIKPKRMTFIEKVNQRVEEQRARRDKARKTAFGVQSPEEEFFQM